METPEQAQFRRHVAELRRAANGLGRDFRVEFENIDESIARLGELTAEELRYAVTDLESDFANLGRAIDDEVRRLPASVANGLASAGTSLATGAVRAATATILAIDAAGRAAREGTKNTAARVAGVKRTPMREWKEPAPAEEAAERGESA
jgi:hypothetical protein